MNPTSAASLAGRARAQVNRPLAFALVAVALAHTSLAERRSGGRGRTVANRWVRRIARVTGIRFETSGHLDLACGETAVIVANHSSPLDIAALLAACPQTRFVAGADLFRVPLLAAAMRALETIPVDRRSRTGSQLTLPPSSHLSRATGAEVFAVFPEGGIPPAGRRLPFHRGAFAAAIKTHATVVPAAIHHSAERLAPKGRLAVRPGPVIVQFLNPIDTTGMVAADRYRLCELAEGSINAALRQRPSTTERFIDGAQRSIPRRTPTWIAGNPDAPGALMRPDGRDHGTNRTCA